MGRSRSRSRSPDGGRRRRSRERRRRRDRSGDRKISKDRSRSPIHSSSKDKDRIFTEEPRGDLAWDRERERLKKKEKQKEPPNFTGGKSFTLTELEGKTDDEVEMMKLMGFTNFDTTKNKKVAGNDQGAVHVSVKRKYRQYMNRKGGFNRPLDYVH